MKRESTIKLLRRLVLGVSLHIWRCRRGTFQTLSPIGFINGQLSIRVRRTENKKIILSNARQNPVTIFSVCYITFKDFKQELTAYTIPSAARDLNSTGNMEALSARLGIATKGCPFLATTAAFDLRSPWNFSLQIHNIVSRKESLRRPKFSPRIRTNQ